MTSILLHIGSIISATLFSITLLIPQLSIITMNIFLIPLFFNKKIDSLNNYRYQKILNGFIWGLIVFTTYWWWLFVLIQKTSNGITGYIFFILLITWCSIISAIWFYFFDKYPSISTTIFFLVIMRYSLILSGSLEGIPGCNPLVLLGEYPALLGLLPWIGDAGMLLLLFGMQSCIAAQINKNDILKVWILFLSILIFQCIAFFTHQEMLRKISEVSVVIPWWYKKGDGMFCGYRLSHDLWIETNKQRSKIIITPESTFCFDLENFQEFVPIWCESANNIPILLSGYSLKEGSSHNCAFLIHNNKIKLHYLKQHAMFLVEKNVWFERLFNCFILSEKLIPTVEEKNNETDLIIINDQKYQLFICSELFFEAKKTSGYPIILLWNDTWLCCNYTKKLALLFIKYFEKKYQVVVHHVATSGLRDI